MFDTLIKDHPVNKTEDLGDGLTVITKIHADPDGDSSDWEYPEDTNGCDWYGVVVTVKRNGQEIGSESLWGIATSDRTDEYLQTIANENRDSALHQARQWLQAEIEAIQSGKREAELFAAVTALNTQHDPNADLKAKGYQVEASGKYFYAKSPDGRSLLHNLVFWHTTEADAWQTCRNYEYDTES